MDPEIKKLLEDNLAVSRENNNILRKLHLAQKWSTFYRIFYWTIIILSTVGAFIFLKPYISTLTNSLGELGIKI